MTPLAYQGVHENTLEFEDLLLQGVEGYDGLNKDQEIVFMQQEYANITVSHILNS